MRLRLAWNTHTHTRTHTHSMAEIRAKVKQEDKVVKEQSKHHSQTDAAKGFGGKYGVQKERQDKVCVCAMCLCLITLIYTCTYVPVYMYMHLAICLLILRLSLCLLVSLLLGLKYEDDIWTICFFGYMYLYMYVQTLNYVLLSRVQFARSLMTSCTAPSIHVMVLLPECRGVGLPDPVGQARVPDRCCQGIRRTVWGTERATGQGDHIVTQLIGH